MTTKAVAEDAATLLMGQYRVQLWGIQAAKVSGTNLPLRGRSAMDLAIGAAPVKCDIVSWSGEKPTARCTNAKGIDLARSMLQEGFAIVNRAAVLGTPYEEPYFTTEETAKAAKKGVWLDSGTGNAQSSGSFSFSGFDQTTQMIIGALFLGPWLLTVILLFLSQAMGFKKLETLMKKNMAMTKAQEDKMRNREKYVMAAMLEGELIANQGKLEAYMVINRDLLLGLKDARDKQRTHKYQEKGEVVQEKPALQRSVFEGNTDKLELLGNQIAKETVALYGNFLSEAQYITLERELPIDQAINKVQRCIMDAESLIDPINSIVNALHIIMRDRNQRKSAMVSDSE